MTGDQLTMFGADHQAMQLHGPFVRPEPRKQVRRSDPGTSRQAAARACGIDGVVREVLMHVFMTRLEFTDDQLHAAARVYCEHDLEREYPAWSDNSTRRVRKALADAGVIVACGRGQTLRGGECRVWRMA